MLDRLLHFIDLTTNFSKVERKVLYKDRKQLENDAEHTFQLAIVAWYLIDSQNLTFNKELILKYALAHDLIEVYAGDTFIYSDEETLKKKHSLEKQAQRKLARNFPEFPELHEMIERYEKRGDAESRFVYALDKVLPVLNIYLDGGKQWKEWKVTLDMMLENKVPKIKVSPEMKPYFAQVVELLHKNRHLFHVKSD